MKENRTLEFKSEVSNTFLKTVSAYANFNSGVIQFGVKDDGTISGITDPDQAFQKRLSAVDHAAYNGPLVKKPIYVK